MNSELFMREALKWAEQARKEDEIPVGAVIVKNGEIISYGYNTRNKDNDVFGHAEINAIKMAQQKLNDWQLKDCDLYVTLEPCLMCCGAIIQARLNKVYFGAKDAKLGGIVSILHMFDLQGLNHTVKYSGEILEHECSEIIKNYFSTKRR